MIRTNVQDLCALIEQISAETSIRLLGVDAVVAEIERALEDVHRAMAQLHSQVKELRERVDRHLPDGRL